MTTSPPDERIRVSRWKRYCSEFDQFFDRHPVTHAIYTFCLLFTLWCIFQVFASPQQSKLRCILSAVFYATFVTVFAVIDRYRAARNRRVDVPPDA